ncbi:hypothetical protein WJX74_009494 [Apatococcus lobatus]|uniref:C2HC zinc finger plants domain-containing protein n=2 Tax=Apatococcus TaxID=904362 RepID=A0AAW1SLJ5_9CHLO
MECEYEQKQGEAVFKVAREQIASGDPVAALQTLLQLLQSAGGASAALPALQRVQEALAGPPKPLQGQSSAQARGPWTSCMHDTASRQHLANDPEHPAEVRRHMQQQALVQAETEASLADGSSRQCCRCGGIISQARWQEHQSFWCGG